jgi:hypothetical protein
MAHRQKIGLGLLDVFLGPDANELATEPIDLVRIFAVSNGVSESSAGAAGARPEFSASATCM